MPASSDLYANNARMTLAQLDMDAARWSDARAELRAAAGGFAGEEAQTGEADVEALALCDQQTGNREGRDQAAARAQRCARPSPRVRKSTWSTSRSRNCRATARASPAAVSKLLALAADAERRQWISWSLEAKLAARGTAARTAGSGARWPCSGI